MSKVLQHSTAKALREHVGLPWCFIDELLKNNLRPDTTWARWHAFQYSKQGLYVLEPLVSCVDERRLQPYICLWTTVIFYKFRPWQLGYAREAFRVEVAPRTYPRISFVERMGELWEVTGGEAVKGGRTWYFRWTCMRNTEWARHYRGLCDQFCRPCRQLSALAPFVREVA